MALLGTAKDARPGGEWQTHCPTSGGRSLPGAERCSMAFLGQVGHGSARNGKPTALSTRAQKFARNFQEGLG